MIEKAFIVPHPPLIISDIGRGEEKQIQNTIDNYKKFAQEIVELNPDTIIISTPHSILYRDYFHISPGDEAFGSFAQFRAPHINAHINYDSDFVESLEQKAFENNLPAGRLGERDPNLDHATLIPLYFLAQADPEIFNKVKFVRIGLSGLPLEDHYELGKLIDEVANEQEKNIVYIASGDLSHVLKEDGPYGFRAEGPEFDQKFVEVVENGDLSEFKNFDEDFCNKASECGLRSFVMLSGALDNYNYNSTLNSYEGPFGVGYGCAEIDIEGEKE